MPIRRKRAAALTTVAALLTTALVAPAVADAATPSGTSTIANSKPSWLAKATKLGGASKTVSARVYLAPRGGLAAAEAEATQLSTPGSADYAHFLSAAQYHAAYDPTKATVSKIESWLTGAGLSVTGVAAHNSYVSFTGSVSAAQKAFKTTLATFKHSGQTVQAPTSDVSVPSGLLNSVLGVDGLDTTPEVMAPTTSTPAAAPSAGFRNARPCSIYYGQIKAQYQADNVTPLPQFEGHTLPYTVCGYTGPQLRAAYEGNTYLSGKGVTVGILDAYSSPTMAKDAEQYAVAHGDGSYAPGQYSQTAFTPFTHQGACGPSGWYGEESLDVEAVHAMAPQADVHFYGAASCYDDDFLYALSNIVNDDAVQIVSDSWAGLEEGESQALINAYETVFVQGAMEGISFTFSTGDDGDELAATGIKQVAYPASDPYVTAVGGTSIAIGAQGTMNQQTGWGTELYSLAANGKQWSSTGVFHGGAGGGTSTLFNKPAYQSALQGGARMIPDISMDADPTTGFLVGQTQTFSDGVYYGEYRIGGTSLASPLFAGFTALTIQHAKHGLGLLNPLLYKKSTASRITDIGAKSNLLANVRVDYANEQDSTDGLVYSVRTFDQDSSLHTATGWDDVTGLGSPNYAWATAVKPAPAS